GVSQALASGAGGGGLTKRGNGALTLGERRPSRGPTVVEAATLVGTGSISGSTAIDVKSGATLDVTAAGGGFTIGGTTTLKGTGTILGNIVMAAGAKLSPGESPGTLTLNDSLDLTAAMTAANSS